MCTATVMSRGTPAVMRFILKDMSGAVSKAGAVGADNVAVEGGGRFRGAFLSRVVHVDQTEARQVAGGPFEVVHKRPVIIGVDFHSVSEGAAHFAQVATHVINAEVVGHGAVGC